MKSGQVFKWAVSKVSPLTLVNQVSPLTLVNKMSPLTLVNKMRKRVAPAFLPVGGAVVWFGHAQLAAGHHHEMIKDKAA